MNHWSLGAAASVVLLLTVLFVGCGAPGDDVVVVYTSVDQPFSQPILEAFEDETGIRVKAVYDVEAAKTTGLVNRLIAEKHNPNADVFWNSEILRTLVLKREGVLARYVAPNAEGIPEAYRDAEGYWTGFAGRARILLYNTDLVNAAHAPTLLSDLAQARWKGQAAMAYPLFGTTSTHVASLLAFLGEARTRQLLKGIVENDIRIVDGNSVVRDLVVAGEVAFGVTDTDDAQVAIDNGAPVRIVYPDQDGMGTLVVPNTVALVAGAPHQESGRRLVDYLLSTGVERRLAFAGSAQIPLREDVEKPDHVAPVDAIHTLDVDFEMVAEHLDQAMALAQDLFVR